MIYHVNQFVQVEIEGVDGVLISQNNGEDVVFVERANMDDLVIALTAVKGYWKLEENAVGATK